MNSCDLGGARPRPRGDGHAIVGNVESRGGAVASKAKEQPHALAYAPGATMPSADAPREPVPVACDEEWSQMPSAPPQSSAGSASI
jgi:hypothetical protein